VLFPTIRFALFFAVVLPVSWLLMPRPVRWRVFMLGASWFFYGAWNWRFVPLLAASVLWNQVFAHVIARTGSSRLRAWVLGIAVAGNLGALGWFKYAGFLSDSGGSILRSAGLDVTPPLVDVALPVGISFFTFQALSYVIDVYRRKVRPASFLDFAVYLSFFPHLVAGPIVRASEFLPQLRHPRDARQVDASFAFWLIVGGLAKKVVVANYLADRIVDPLFAVPGRHGGIEALAGIYAYAVQIYADFSGYTDIAIGVALLLGFTFPQNFDRPYSAASLQEFWRRWHMTLSRWLRDYLYVPLGGSRGGGLRTYRNLMLTMVLGGLWHGAAWTFVIWGAMHGVGLAVERWWGERRADTAARSRVIGVAGRWARRIVTFNIVCLAWVFFRAESVDRAFDVLARLGTAGSTALNPVVVVLVVAALAAQFVPADAVARARGAFARLGAAPQALALGAAIVVIDALGPPGVAPFIYFRF
jgi:D-alanyl-lipoteichoic acid acyltransferase DltB (MBOAT superfamily)